MIPKYRYFVDILNIKLTAAEFWLAANYVYPTFYLLGAIKQPYLLLISSGQTTLVWNLQTTHFHRMSQDVRVLRLFV